MVHGGAKTEELAELRRDVGDPAVLVHGWNYDPANIGAFGGDYHQRALVAMNGLGANRREDAVYPSTHTDKSGRLLEGRKQYVLHFAKGELPPTNAFWSLTAYDQEWFPMRTPQRRYAVGDRDPLVFNADGSLDLYLGSKPPPVAGSRANWLPTSEGPFNIILRVYAPKASLLEGRWRVPPVVEIHGAARSDLSDRRSRPDGGDR